MSLVAFAPLARGIDATTPAGKLLMHIVGAIAGFERARDEGGVMPRVFGVNHHPEIVNRARLLDTLEKQFERGDVNREWYEGRKKTLTEPVADQWGDRLIHLTSSYTFMAPLRFHLYKLARLRGEALARPLAIDEAALPLSYAIARGPRTRQPRPPPGDVEILSRHLPGRSAKKAGGPALSIHLESCSNGHNCLGFIR